MSFSGKTVLITGASAGFGAATAKLFSESGAKLVLGDISAEGLGEGISGDFVTLVGDVRDPAYSKELVKLSIDTFGSLDIAINNAGIVHSFAKIPDLTEAESRKVIDVNLLGVFWALQAQLPVMEAQFAETGEGCAVVNLASVAGLGGASWLSIYGASKHGVVGLTRAAALEYARKGIRVNAICPSFAATAMAGEAVDDPEVESHMTRGVPMRRLATVNEVVQAILWAADPANSFTTGQNIAIDGGLGAL
ncbi:oxidoreductase [Rhodobacterales bacterium 52_120_T64]|nr:oxidoreductase [Rhodobacterales bacterium 52_120_T64]